MKSVPLNPDQAHAIVVGIEKYDAGESWNLNGPARDARGFVDWLISQGVPTTNILFYASPLDQNKDLGNVVDLVALPATRDNIYNGITRDLRSRQGSLLFVFWAGHGILTTENARRLLYADSTQETKLNLDFTSLLASLRTDYFSGFSEQILILDTCANYIPNLGVKQTLPSEVFPYGQQPLYPRNQFVLLAAKAGDTAKNLSTDGLGLFSKIVAEELGSTAASWPPDMPALAARVDAKFAQLRAEHKVSQTPTYYWYHGKDDREGSIGTLPTLHVRSPFLVPYRQNTLFVGRKDQLDKLDGLLSSGNRVALASMGGMGKTQLAVEAAYTFRARFTGGIFWLPGQSDEGLREQIAALADSRALNLPGSTVMAVDEKVASVLSAWEDEQPRLLIFDGLDDPNLLQKFTPKFGGSCVLITTRRAVWPTQTGVHVELLKPLDREDSLTLLLSPRAHQQGSPIQEALAEDPASAASVCELLGNLPLAVALAGTYLEDYSDSLKSYLSQLKAATLDHPSLDRELEAELPTGHATSIAATFSMSYDRLDPGKPTDLTSTTILHKMAHCASSPIPRKLVMRLGNADAEHIASMHRLDDALRRLHNLGLVEPLNEGSQHLHRLLAAFIRRRSPSPEKDQVSLYQALVAEVAQIIFTGYAQEGHEYVDHLRHAIEEARQRDEELTFFLNSCLASLLQEMGDFLRARTYSETALEMAEERFGRYHPVTVEPLEKLAGILLNQGLLGEARTLYERAYTICELVHGPGHPLISSILNGLAAVMIAQDQLDEARPLLERALAISRQVHGPGSEDTLAIMNSLAIVLKKKGEFNAARVLYEYCLEAHEARSESEHPTMATTLNNLGLLVQAQGELDQAESYFRRSIGITERTLGSRHPDAAIRLNNLALVLEEKSDIAQARLLLEQTLNLAEETLGPDHPFTAAVCNNLGSLLHTMGNLTEAQAFYERALEIRKRTLGDTHFETATTVGNIASLLMEKGELNSALELMENAIATIEQAVGPSHYSLAVYLTHLAEIRERQGKSAEAAKVLKRALNIRLQALGVDHPKTIESRARLIKHKLDHGDFDDLDILIDDTSEQSETATIAKEPNIIYEWEWQQRNLQNQSIQAEVEAAITSAEEALGPNHPVTAHLLVRLALVLKGRGQLADAKVALERAVSIDEQALGLNHRNSIEATNALAGLLMEQGDLSAARPLFERVLASRRETLGVSHHETLLSLNNLSVCLLEQGDLEAARHLLNEARSSLDEIPEDSADMLIVTLNNFGGVFYRSRDFPTALATWEQALVIAERVYGDSHFLTAPIHHNIGDLLREQGDFEMARRHLELALQTWEQTLPPDHPNLSKCLFVLGKCLIALGELEQAEALLRRCVAMREKMLDPHSTETAQSIAQLAGVLERRGQWEEACSLHERALSICEQTHTSDDPSVGLCMYNLGHCRAQQRNFESAEELLTRSVDNLGQSLGSSHPVTAKVADELQKVREERIKQRA